MTTTTPAPRSSPTGAAPAATDYQSDAAQALMERCLQQARNDSARKARDRADWWNLLMYRGGENQWKVWDRATERYVDRGTDPATGGIPAHVPRCCTNHFAVKIDGIAAILDQTSPAKECGPGAAEDRDRAAAEVANDALPVLFEEIGYEDDRSQIHKLVTLTDRVGYVLYCDNDEKYGTDHIPALQCQACGEFAGPAELTDDDTCPHCGKGPMVPAQHPQTGELLAYEYPKGRLCGSIATSFELSTPPNSRTTDTRKLPWVLRHRRTPREEVLARWPELREKLTDEGTNDQNNAAGAMYADALAGLVAPLGNDGRPAGASGLWVAELWHDPIDDGELKFPQGLYRVMVGDHVAHSGPLEYVDDDGRPFKNVLIRTFATAPGGGGKPPGDDLAPIQVQHNVVESLIDLATMNYAAGKDYIPLSVTLIDEPTGAPGERIRYKSNIPGEVPTHVEGKSPAAGLFERLKQLEEAMDSVSRLNAVLAGERPEGDPTLGEVQRLDENGMRAFRAPLDELVRWEKQAALMCLRIARQTSWSERFAVIRGENGGWEVDAFIGADLDGRVDIFIDKASAWPKSPMLESLRLKEGFETGLLPSPAAADPELAGKLLSALDLAKFKPSLDGVKKHIARELDRWKKATDPAEITPPDPLILGPQAMALHLALKRAFMVTEEAEAMAADPARQPVYMAMRAHLEQLQLLLTPQPMPAPGDGDVLGQAVASGALKPVSEDKGSNVGELVRSGALRPAPDPPAAQGTARPARGVH